MNYDNTDERIRIETDIYDKIARQRMKKIAETVVEYFGEPLVARWLSGEIARFPSPLWVDSTTSSDTQLEAYTHLAPLDNCRFLQFGGGGSHAIKALMAGASAAYILSPSLGELDLAMAMARYMRVESGLIPLRGIGERIPLDDASVDRIYGGGCLHHTDINLSIPEIARILSPEGRAAFVDPIQNSIYSTWMRIFCRVRFCGEEEGTMDSPLRVAHIRNLASSFAEFRVYESGGLVRYWLVAIQRILRKEVPVFISLRLLRAERSLLRILRQRSLYNSAAFLFEK